MALRLNTSPMRRTNPCRGAEVDRRPKIAIALFGLSSPIFAVTFYLLLGGTLQSALCSLRSSRDGNSVHEVEQRSVWPLTKPRSPTSTGRSIAKKSFVPCPFSHSFAFSFLHIYKVAIRHFVICTISHLYNSSKKATSLSRSPLRLTLPATFCALSSSIAVQPVLSQRLCMLRIRCLDGP